MDYESEEQQVEALKKWWEENGRSVILGVVIGGAAIGGWQWWGHHQLTTAQNASDAYVATMDALTEKGDVVAAAATVKSEHGDSLYAVMASLAAARDLVEKNDLSGAAEQLRWAIDNAEQADVAVIAKIRLARVLGASGDADAALALLPTQPADVFTGLIEEVRGDLYVAKGETELARTAYQAALDSGQRLADANALNMKLEDLVVVGEDAS